MKIKLKVTSVKWVNDLIIRNRSPAIMLSAIGMRWRTCVLMVLMFVLIMKLLTCCNYSYVLSTINCLTLDSFYSISIYFAQCTYFLFIYHSVPISYSFTAVYLFLIHLPQCTYFLFIYPRSHGTAFQSHWTICFGLSSWVLWTEK